MSSAYTVLAMIVTLAVEAANIFLPNSKIDPQAIGIVYLIMAGILLWMVSRINLSNGKIRSPKEINKTEGKTNKIICKNTMYLRFFIYLLLSVFILWQGYYGFFNKLINAPLDKYNFIFQLSLLGIFVGAVIFSRKANLKNWNELEFSFYGYMCFTSSLIMIISLGLQGIFFSDSQINLSTFIIQIGNYGATFGIILLLTSLIGLLIMSIYNTPKI